MAWPLAFWWRARRRRRLDVARGQGGAGAASAAGRAPGVFYWLLLGCFLLVLQLAASGPEPDWRRLAGDSLLQLLGLTLAALLCRRLPAESCPGRGGVLLFVVIAVLTLLGVQGCLWLAQAAPGPAADFYRRLAPLALAPLLTVILMGPAPAVLIGGWSGYAASILAGGDQFFWAASLALGLAAARLGRLLRSRARVLRLGLLSGLLAAAFAAAAALAAGQPWLSILRGAAAALAGSLAAALLVLMLLPLLEMAFGISTDISLLELSDLEHPLLKRLAIEAAGTYHHSLMTANLAQAALAAIGGNALRASICAYFHDIGKLVKPGLFSENAPPGANPHAGLQPSISALVVVAHVKEGVNLALEYRLPTLIVEAIRRHHGTGLVSFFFQQAVRRREQEAAAANGGAVREEDFRYPGPKPDTRETAVLSLADAVEAASRSLEKFSPGHVAAMVHEVVGERLRDGQLDDCRLSLAELSAVERALAFTLAKMLHSRVPYPLHENRDQ